MKEKSFIHRVPIWNVVLELVVGDDIKKSQKKEPRFSKMGSQDLLDCAAVTMYNGWNFCIIFDTHYLNHEIIAHECFHATHRILDYCCKEFRLKNHEEFAYLHGYLGKFVYNRLKKWKIRIKH